MSEQQEKKPTVFGIGAEDFASWRHHPVTKLVRRYFSDKRQFFERSILDQWIAGSLTPTTEQTVRGQIIELFEGENLPFEALVSFYQDIEEENGREADQDPAR